MWGEGDFSVSVFHAMTFEEERDYIDVPEGVAAAEGDEGLPRHHVGPGGTVASG